MDSGLEIIFMENACSRKIVGFRKDEEEYVYIYSQEDDLLTLAKGDQVILKYLDSLERYRNTKVNCPEADIVLVAKAAISGKGNHHAECGISRQIANQLLQELSNELQEELLSFEEQ